MGARESPQSLRYLPSGPLQKKGPIPCFQEKGNYCPAFVRPCCGYFMTRPIFGRRTTPLVLVFTKLFSENKGPVLGFCFLFVCLLGFCFFFCQFLLSATLTCPKHRLLGGKLSQSSAALGLKYYFNKAGVSGCPLFHRESGSILCHLLSHCLMTDFWHMLRAICT